MSDDSGQVGRTVDHSTAAQPDPIANVRAWAAEEGAGPWDDLEDAARADVVAAVRAKDDQLSLALVEQARLSGEAAWKGMEIEQQRATIADLRCQLAMGGATQDLVINAFVDVIDPKAKAAR